MRTMKWGAAVLTVLWGSGAGHLMGQRWQVAEYGVTDGLPGSRVVAIAQHHSGVMFFATRRGLAAYDGAAWVTESAEDDQYAGPTYLLPGKRNGMWSYSGHWHRRRGVDGWSELRPAPLSSEAAAGAVSVRRGGSARIIVAARSGGIHVLDDESWSEIGPSRRTVSRIDAVVSVMEKAWVATDQGMMTVDPWSGRVNALDLRLPNRRIYGITHDPRADAVWLVGQGFITRVDGVASGDYKIGIDEEVSFAAPVSPVSTAADLAGGLYFADVLGIHHFHPQGGLTGVGRGNGLSVEGANCLFRDREGNIWVGAARGANKIVGREFGSFDRDHGLFDDEVCAVLERADGSFVLGHDGGLTVVTKTGAVSWTVDFETGPRLGRVLDVVEAPSGELWAAVEYRGLARVGNDASFEFVGNEPGAIVGLEVSSNGQWLWVGTNQGLFRYQDSTWTEVDLGVDEIALRRVCGDLSGGVLVCSFEHGLFSVTEDGAARQWTADEFGERSCFTALRSSTGTLWVGTRAGLSRAESGGKLVLSEGPPRVRRPVYSLTEDHRGRLWIGTDTGIFRWDGTELAHFTATDGVSGQEANRAAALTADDGRVWFGTDRGLTVYDERFDVPHIHGPTVILNDVEAGGVFFSMRETVELPHTARTLFFHFSAISFTNEEQIRFEYVLEGFDEDWAVARLIPSREIRYTNLPTGDYRFKVRAIDVDGAVSREVISPIIRISEPPPPPSPPWKSAGFQIAAALIGLIMVGGAVTLVVQRRYAGRLELEVAARTDEVRAMEREQENLVRLDSLGLLAGGIAHDFNNILTAIVGNVSLLERQNIVSEDSRVLIRDVEDGCGKARALADQLLTFARGGAPVLKTSSIVTVIRESVRFGLRGSAVESSFDLSDDLWAVEADPGQISQVINNLMINARQAMPEGGSIFVGGQNVTRPDGEREILIEVVDDGPGIPEDIVGRVFDPYFSTKEGRGQGLGLTTAYSIIRRHGGHLSVSSSVGHGTTFRIVLPATDRPLETTPSIHRPGHSIPSGITVMVMDDQAEVRAVVRRALECENCEVIEAEDGQSAIDHYRRALRGDQPIDAILMDLTVPGGMGGLEATTRVLEMDSEARIIVASGYAENAVLADHAAHGFAARLNKPFRPKDLVRTVAEVLSKPRAHAADNMENS